MAENQVREAGPHSPTFLTLVLKTFAGLGGGIAGMLIMLVIFLSASAILAPAFNPNLISPEESAKNPLFIFVFMSMIFLTSLGANLLGALFFSFVDRERYSRRQTALSQIFFVNLFIFLILAPIYLLLDTRSVLDMTAFLAGFHVLLAALASVIILEVIGNLKYALVGVYGVILALIGSTGFIMVAYELSGRNTTLVLFSALPIMWTALGFVTVIMEMFYRWVWTLYGTDFLMSTTDYGQDYGETEPEDAPLPPDVAGSEFLKK